MEETTTAEPTDGGVEASTQPAQVEQQAAAQPPEPQSQAGTDDTAAWLQAKGLNRDDPEYADKLLKMAFNQEKLMTKATQRASELEKTLNTSTSQPSNDGMQEFIQEYRQEKMVNNFKQSHPDWQQYDSPMTELLLEEVPTAYGTFPRRELVSAGLMTLEDVYVMAKGKSFNVDSIKADTKNEVLQQLANQQRAGGASSNAIQSNPSKPEVDPITEAIRKSRG